MSNLHIVAIGGTGHKVLTSIIHLAACGVFRRNPGAVQIKELRVLTIDADESNYNLSQTRKVLDAYQNFSKALLGGDFGLVNIEPVSPAVNLSLYDSEKKSIKDTFNIPGYDGFDEDKFVRFLYTDDEINAEFNQGFYGHTSIGTLIVKDILSKHKTWEDFLAQINSNDFVVVIGSIFGGTGASSIPVVLEELKKKNNTSFNVAALILTPYFSTVGDIKEEGVLQPDSENFNIKAKASLYYYYAQEQYKKTDALYIIGEPKENFSKEAASRGSSKQRNKAHPIELYAATAVLDFIKENRRDCKIITAERDSDKNGKYCYTWKMLQNGNQDLPSNMQRFMRTAIFFNKVLYGDLAYGKGAGIWQNFYPEVSTKLSESGTKQYETIYGYLKLFVNWVYDLHKENLDKIDQNRGTMQWVANKRVKLFNDHPGLFDNTPVSNGVIPGFEELVYNEGSGKSSEKIYHDICSRQPAGAAGDFAALFTTLYEIIKRPEKKWFPRFFTKKAASIGENYHSIPYLSQENDISFQRPDAEPNKLWSSSDPKLLKDIADGLPNTLGKSFTKNDLSIPSPWSIFIMNELSLKEPKFASLNQEIYNQWCGLIALLALRKINRYENNGLKFEKLEFKHRPEPGYSEIKKHSDFFNIIRDTCRPASYIFKNQEWTQCCRAALNDKTIAFLANNTLVCPAYSYDQETWTLLHKIAPTIVNENGGFLPPNVYFEDQSRSLNRDSKYALSLFLKELKSILTMLLNEKNDMIALLQEKIDRYIQDLGMTAPNNEISIHPDIKPNIKNICDVFEKLCPVSNTAAELPFVLDGTMGDEAAALIGLTVCGIASDDLLKAAAVFVTENLLYNQINRDSIQELKNKKKDNILLIYDNDLLCDSMILIRKEDDAVFYALPNNSFLQDYAIVWPINEKLLEMYSADTINKMLSAAISQESVTVTLTLKLRGGSHSVSKEYRIIPSGLAEKDKNGTR